MAVDLCLFCPRSTDCACYRLAGFFVSTGLARFQILNPVLNVDQPPGRCIIVGSITGNTNTLAGNIPPKADLGDLSGLANRNSMCDAGIFDGAKAYKDAKVCNMLTMRQLHK